MGNVLGVFFITPLSDRFGRRMALFFGSVVAILGTALCTGAINGMFLSSYIRVARKWWDMWKMEI